MKLIFDFETYSECNLKTHGVYKYARHESTKILCTAYYFDGQYFLIQENGLYNHFSECVKRASKLISFNYFFEREILKNVLGIDVDDSKWSCLSARCRTYGLPRSLEASAIALNLDLKKDMAGRKALLKVCKPNPRRVDREKELSLVYEYCLKDVQVSKLIDDHVPELSTSEKKVFELDRVINDRGIPLDIKAAVKMKYFCQQYTTAQNEKLKDLTAGGCDRATAPAKILKYLNEYHSQKLKELSIKTVTDLLAKDNLNDNVREILEIRSNVAKSSVKKLDAMISSQIDGKFCGGLVFNGAHTGRWAGSGLQIQNFPRSGIENADEIFQDISEFGYADFNSKYGKINHLASKLLRSFIKDDSGLVYGDFSAIEARIVMWLAECDLGLSQFNSGRPIYEEMAARIYNKKVSDVIKEERQLGKTVVLGSGFGLGHEKFHASCIKQGIFITEELAKNSIKTFRDTYKEIVQLWYGLENAAIQAVKTGEMHQYNCIKYKKIKDWLFCELPSKRKLAYFSPTVEKKLTPWGVEKDCLTYMGVQSQTRKFVRHSTFGGSLAENVTQAVARDCIVNSMFNLETAGYEILFTVHDEIVAHGIDKNKFKEVMEIRPDWGKSIPIKTETGEGVRYGK